MGSLWEFWFDAASGSGTLLRPDLLPAYHTTLCHHTQPTALPLGHHFGILGTLLVWCGPLCLTLPLPCLPRICWNFFAFTAGTGRPAFPLSLWSFGTAYLYAFGHAANPCAPGCVPSLPSTRTPMLRTHFCHRCPRCVGTPRRIENQPLQFCCCPRLVPPTCDKKSACVIPALAGIWCGPMMPHQCPKDAGPD